MAEPESPVPDYTPVRLDREYLAGKALDLWREKNGKAWRTTSAHQKGGLLEDFGGAISALEESLATGSPALLIDYVRWLDLFARSRHLPAEYVASLLAVLSVLAEKELPPDHRSLAGAVLRQSAGALAETPGPVPSFIGNENPHAALAASYLGALLKGDRESAVSAIDRAAGSGVAVRDLYLNVILPVLRETGRLWQVQEITIAQEHYISASTQAVIARLHDRILSAGTGSGHRDRTLVAASVGGESHDIGIRIVADFFEMDGWTTYYTGANTPTESLLSVIRDRKTDAVAISVTMPSHIPAVHHLIRSIRGDRRTGKVKILVGGYPFRIVPSLWQQLGADASASDPDETVTSMNRLVGTGS